MRDATGTTIARSAVYDDCFGCGPNNVHGLRLAFEELRPGVVQCRYRAPDHFRGPEGVVHGGIQATLLDEVIGMAIESGIGEGKVELVTAGFELRYRRPVPTAAPILVRASYERTEGRSHFASGEIQDAAGEICTTASARWVRVV